MFKVARRLKLKNLPLCTGLSGGRAIELAARDGNIHAFNCIPVMSQLADCNFSFAGIKAWALRTVEKDEEKYGMLLQQFLLWCTFSNRVSTVYV